MAVKTFRVAATTTNNTGDLIDGTDQTAATRTDGWTSAKIASTNASDFDAATKQTSGTFAAASGKPVALAAGATANAFGTTAPLNGTFAATAWTFTFAVRATVASSQVGRMRMRVFKSANATGAGATELTGATVVGTTSAALSTSADVTSVVTWSPGTTIILNNEYLFFSIAWEITTAGGSNSADVQIRTGQSAAGSRLVTPDFVPPQTLAIGRKSGATVVRGVTVTATGAAPIVVGRVVTGYPGAVGLWLLDENPASHGSSIVDATGCQHTGTLMTGDGATNKSVVGQSGRALTFDGVNDYVSITTKPGEGLGASDFTVVGWIRDTSNGTLPRMIIARDDEQVGGRQFIFNLHASTAHSLAGILVGSIFASEANYIQVESGAGTITPNVWHHVAFRRLAGVLSLWIDGVNVPITTYPYGTGTPGLTIQNTNAECRIGARSYTGSECYFQGDIDRMGINSRGLSDAEIVTLASPGGDLRVRGVTFFELVTQAVPVGKRVAATAVRGVTLAPGLATVPIGSVKASLPPAQLLGGGNGSGGGLFIGGQAVWTKLAQSFQLGSLTTLTDLQIYCGKRSSPTDNIIAEIQADSGGVPSGVALGSMTLSAASFTGAAFQSLMGGTLTGLQLGAGKTYWLVVSRSGALDYTNNVSWYFNSDDFYPAGARATWDGATWFTYPTDFGFKVFGSSSSTVVRGITFKDVLPVAIGSVPGPFNEMPDHSSSLGFGWSPWQATLRQGFYARGTSIKELRLWLSKVGAPTATTITANFYTFDGVWGYNDTRGAGTLIGKATLPVSSLTTTPTEYVLSGLNIPTTPGVFYVMDITANVNAADSSNSFVSGLGGYLSFNDQPAAYQIAVVALQPTWGQSLTAKLVHGTWVGGVTVIGGGIVLGKRQSATQVRGIGSFVGSGTAVLAIGKVLPANVIGVSATGGGLYGVGQVVANTKVAQSFRFGSDFVASSLQLYIQRSGSPADNFQVEIQSDNAGVPSGTLIGGQNVLASTIATAAHWHAFATGAPTLLANTTYWIVLSRSGALDVSNCVFINTAPGDYYAGGNPRRWNGAGWTVDSSDLGFQIVMPPKVYGVTLGRQENLPIGRVAPSIAYSAAVLASAPLAYWRLGEAAGTSAIDASGNGNNGTYSGATLGQAGATPGNTAVAFDGVDDTLTLPVSVSIPAGSSISVEWWQYVASGDVKSSVAFSLGNDGGANRIQSHAPWSDGVLYWDYGNVPEGRVSTSYAAYLNKWTHIVLTFDAATGTHAITLDGVEVASTVNGTALGKPGSVMIGGSIGNQASVYHKAVMDEFAVYTRVLTPAERLAHYSTRMGTGASAVRGVNVIEQPPSLVPIGRVTGATAAYSSVVLADSPAGYWQFEEASGGAVATVSGITLNDNGTVAGVAGLLSAFPLQKGRRFVAPSSFMNGGAQPFKYNTTTWEVWIKRTRTNAAEILVDQYNGGYRLWINSDGTLYLSHSYGNAMAHTVSRKILDTNAHHVVFTRAGLGGAITFYVDGVAEVGTADSEFSYDVGGWPNYAIFVGSTWGSSGFDGTMDEFAVYPSVLSPARVAAHYSSGTVIPGTAVVRGVAVVAAPSIIPIGRVASAAEAGGASYSDDFNRGTLGANWAQAATYNFSGTPTIASNEMVGKNAAAKWNVGSPFATGRVRATIRFASKSVMDPFFGVVNANGDGYFVEIPQNTVIVDYLPAADWYDAIGGNTSFSAYVSGGEFAFEVAAGGVLTVLYRDTPGSGGWTTVATRTDTRYGGPWRPLVGFNEGTSGTSRVDDIVVEPLVAALPQVKGVTLSGTGTAAPIVLGRAAAVTSVRGATLLPGTAGLTVGKRAAATTVRGATFVISGTAPIPVGQVPSFSSYGSGGYGQEPYGGQQVNGLTIVPGVATVPIGKRAAATSVKGVGFVVSGSAILLVGQKAAATTVRGVNFGALLIGSRAAATTVRGATLVGAGVAPVAVGRVAPVPSYSDDFDRASLGANWVRASLLSLGGTPTIVANEFVGVYAGAKYVAGSTYTDNFRVRATYRFANNVGPNPWVGIINAADSGYFADIEGAWTYLDKNPADGQWINVGPGAASPVFVTGGEWAFEISGTTMKVRYRDPGVAVWTDVFSVADATFAGPWRAFLGINDNTQGNSRLDNFVVEPLVVQVPGIKVRPAGTVPITVGRRAAATTVPGVTVLALGAAPVAVGKRIATTVARGVTVAPTGAAPVTIGRRAAATTTRGVTLAVAGAAPIPVGRRVSATTVRGIPLTGTGTIPLPVGRSVAVTSVRGVTAVQGLQVVPIGRVAPGAPFTPTSMTGLGVWLDASQLGLADGADVTTWANLANGAAPGTMVGTPAPTVRANALQGKPVVRFTHDNGRVRLSGSAVTGDWTLVYVGRMWGAVSGRIVTALYPPNNLLVGFWTSYEDVLYNEGFATPDTRTGFTTSWKLYSADYAPGQTDFRSDGVLLGSTATGASWSGNLAISGYSPAGPEETCDCEIAEVVMFSRKLTGPERQQVENYLRTKWITGGGAGGTVVRGVTLGVAGTAPIPVGAVAKATAVRGVGVAGTGVVPLPVGRRAAASTVRGVAVTAAGVAPLPIGRRVAATTVRGATLVGSGAAPPVLVGRRGAATTVRGATLAVAGAAPIPVGRKAAATTVRGATLTGTGTITLLVGKVAAATTTRGIVLAPVGAPLPIGKVQPWSPFTPSQLSGAGSWFDASQLGLADGAAIASWPDLSGQGRHLTSSGGGPLLRTNVLNGKPVVRLDGVDDVLTASAAGTYQHLFAVAKFRTNAFPDYNGLLTGLAGNEIFFIGTGGGTQWYPPVGTNEMRRDGVVDPNRFAPMGVWDQFGLSYAVGWPGVTLQVGLDRVYPPRYWDGDVAEVIAYDRVLSDTERQQVEGYLRGKWFTGVIAGQVRGITVVPSGVAPVTVGKRVAATAVRGVTLIPGPVTVPIGKRLAATAVRGVTAVQGTVPLGVSLVLAFGKRVLATRSAALPYATRATTARALVQPYGVRRAIPRSLAVPYAVTVRLARSLAVPYLLRQSATRGLALLYALRFGLGRSLALPYGKRVWLPRSLALPFGIKVTATRSAGLPYLLRSRTGASAVLPYAKRALAARALVQKFGIAGAVARVLVQPWLVRQRASQTCSLPYGIRVRVALQLVLPYLVRKAIARSCSLAYSVIAHVARVCVLPWTVKTRVGTSLVLTWPIRFLVGQGLVLPYAAQRLIVRLLDLPFIVWNELGRSLGLPYYVPGKTGLSLQMTWRLRLDLEHPLGVTVDRRRTASVAQLRSAEVEIVRRRNGVTVLEPRDSSVELAERDRAAILEET